MALREPEVLRPLDFQPLEGLLGEHGWETADGDPLPSAVSRPVCGECRVEPADIRCAECLGIWCAGCIAVGGEEHCPGCAIAWEDLL